MDLIPVGTEIDASFNPRPPVRRIPNLLHLFIFLALTAICFVACELCLLAIHPHHIQAAIGDQRLQLFVNIATYALALAASWFAFPLLWQRSFFSGISWNFHRARLLLIPAGVALGLATEAVSTLLPIPKAAPIQKIFATPGIIWTLALFGTLVAPLFEEIVFRGFLLPGLALVIDYLRLPKSLDALHAWQAGDTFSRPALVGASVLTSLAFGGVHAAQLGFAWPNVALLTAVSLVLCLVRIRTGSVAVSTLLHASYNLSIFLGLFIVTGGFRHMDKL